MTLLLGSAALSSGSATAQNGGEVGLYGYVAPRCWAAGSSSSAQGSGSARCNQVAPLLRSNVRMFSMEGPPVTSTRTARADAAQQSSRTALEIIVSPQL